MRLRASEVAAAVGGALHGRDTEVDGAAIDSRRLHHGELFVPIIGRRDGHDYIPDALAAGASAYLTVRPPRGGTAVMTDDTAAALNSLAHWARRRLPDRIVAVTGSVGKTTTKDLLAAVLARRFLVGASPRSFNNELGVPLSLLGAPADAGAVVVEMGTGRVGEIARHCELTKPTAGIVTMVARAHLETLDDLAGVARAKAELVETLPGSGLAVLNADDPWVAPVFSLGGAADVRLAARGEHQVGNALAAAALALAWGVPLYEVTTALERARPSHGRMQLRRTPSGALLLDDADNASPASMTEALRSLARLPAERRVAILGAMAELGAALRRLPPLRPCAGAGARHPADPGRSRRIRGRAGGLGRRRRGRTRRDRRRRRRPRQGQPHHGHGPGRAGSAVGAAGVVTRGVAELLNLTEQDLPASRTGAFYPLEPVRARRCCICCEPARASGLSP